MSAPPRATSAVGTVLPPLTVRLSRTDLVRYAGASGDLNPIHHSDHFAAGRRAARRDRPRPAHHGHRAPRGHRLGGRPGPGPLVHRALHQAGRRPRRRGRRRAAVVHGHRRRPGGHPRDRRPRGRLPTGRRCWAPPARRSSSVAEAAVGRGSRRACWPRTPRCGSAVPPAASWPRRPRPSWSQVVRDLDAAGEPVLVLGGGSNVLVGDAGFDGTVVKVATRGIDEDVAACSGAVLTVAAGEPWESLVRHTLDHEQAGLETLAGIPGLDRRHPDPERRRLRHRGRPAHHHRPDAGPHAPGRVRTFFAVECQFGYRSSRFKREPGRYLVLSVTFQLRLGSLSGARPLPRAGPRAGRRGRRSARPAREVAEAVLALRRGKGMVLDDADPDTWSAGSFFTNPRPRPGRGGRAARRAPRASPRPTAGSRPAPRG